MIFFKLLLLCLMVGIGACEFLGTEGEDDDGFVIIDRDSDGIEDVRPVPPDTGQNEAQTQADATLQLSWRVLLGELRDINCRAQKKKPLPEDAARKRVLTDALQKQSRNLSNNERMNYAREWRKTVNPKDC